MNPEELKTKLKLKKLAYIQLYQGADDLLEDGTLFWTERMLLHLVRRLARARMKQVGDVPSLVDETAEGEVREAHLEAMTTAGRHGLGLVGFGMGF